MILTVARLLERTVNLPVERGVRHLTRLAVLVAAFAFLAVATVIVAFSSLFPGYASIANLEVGSVAPTSIYAPESRSYISRVLTDQRREEARNAVTPIYNAADLNVARAQTALAGRILEYIENVRRDPYATLEQRRRDLDAITALDLPPEVTDQVLQMDDEKWKAVDGEVRALLEQVMQDSIREVDLPGIIDRLPNQVSLRFNEQEVQIIVAFVQDLIRPNRTINIPATDAARDAAANNIADVEVNFQRGQIVVSEGARVQPADFEALMMLGLLQPADRRVEQTAQAVGAILVVMTIFGLYVERFHRSLLSGEPRLLLLMAIIFLVVLAGARFTLSGQFYLFPTAVVGLLFAAIVSPQVALMGTLGLAFLVAVMANNSLELAALVVISGFMGVLTLRRPERITSYFASGFVISIACVVSALIFNITTSDALRDQSLPTLLFAGALNGAVSAATAIVSLFIIGQVFNLPTAIRLIELSQPNQPLLQRLLRDAPGTYQHTLQVANLCEQAANAIGANAALVYVAALYHDIGKMQNAAFFTENQRDIGRNPHDTLNDPYRSAEIIIGHVTGGDELARKYRLPNRIRDFIREHHGTSQVYVFYQQALLMAGDDQDAVDASAFTYPGPRPRSRETAIMMLADSAEATLRATQPETRQQIEEIIDRIFEDKRRSGQLDDSGLTLNELNRIRRIFVDLFKGMFHPRINYAETVSRMRQAAGAPPTPRASAGEPAAASADDKPTRPTRPSGEVTSAPPRAASRTTELPKITAAPAPDDDDPLPDVPPLPRAGNGKTREIRGTGEPTPPAQDREDARPVAPEDDERSS